MTSRLDRLGAAKEVAEIGAIIGRQFSYDLLAAVAPHGEKELRDALDRLTDSRIVNCVGKPPNSVYTFRHALIQDAAYCEPAADGAPAPAQPDRRGARAARRKPNRPAGAAGVSLHEGRRSPKAIARWQEAGDQARERAAHVEAIRHLRTALHLLTGLPSDPERGRLELQLHVALGINLEATGGYAAPEVAQNYARARELCEQLGYTTETVPVLLGLFVFHLVRADHSKSRASSPSSACNSRSARTASTISSIRARPSVTCCRISESSSLRCPYCAAASS